MTAADEPVDVPADGTPAEGCVDPSTFRGGWDRASLPDNIEIGPGCYLEAASIFERFRSQRRPGLVIGAGVTIHTWTAFSVEPEGYVEIGDRSIVVGVQFMCAERIVIGRDVVVSYQVILADSDFHPLDPHLRRADAIANAPGGDRSTRPALETRPVTIEDGAWIGIGALVLKGVTVGAGARILPGTVVTRDIPAGSTWAGNPARPVPER